MDINDFSKKIGVSPGYASKMFGVNAMKDLPLRRLYEWSQLLNLPMQELLNMPRPELRKKLEAM